MEIERNTMAIVGFVFEIQPRIIPKMNPFQYDNDIKSCASAV